MIKLFKSSIPKLFIKLIPAQMFRSFFFLIIYIQNELLQTVKITL